MRIPRPDGSYIETDDLRAGASNEADTYYEGGLSPAVVIRMADELMADKTPPASTPPEGGVRRNKHLDGYGHPGNPYREVD